MGYDLSTAENLFKIKYGKLSDNVYNSANVLLGRVKKDYTFTGRQYFVPVPISFGGGVGSGILPTANSATYEDALINAKKMYSVIEVDREAIKASANDEGAFVRLTKEAVQKGVESYMRNASRVMFGTGDGSLADGDGATNVSGVGSSGDPFVVALNPATFNEANLEERDFVNYDSETTQLEIVLVDPSVSAPTVSLVGTSAGLTALTGAGPVPIGTFIHMQNSKDNDPAGLKGVLDATTGTLYSIPVARRWSATQEAAGGAGVTVDIINKVMLDVEKKCGKTPNLLLTSYKQYRKILNLLEDQKRYELPARSPALKGLISFKGVEFMSTTGPVGLFPDRFCDEDRIYALNDNYITMYHRPDFGWFDDDGTVFLRQASSDSYGARYGGYYETYIPPSFHGVITGLA